MIPVPRRAPTDLPVEDASDQVIEAVVGGSLVLTAEPGAGKSSLVPWMALEALTSTGAGGTVMVLEPRRLAARSTAERLASLVGQRVGETVGVTMRGDRRVGPQTRIEVVTEAVLTARLQRDPSLEGVDALVFDEFHERNLHSDLGLAMALEIRESLRPRLALVVMSATIDVDPLVARLGRSPVVAVPGRTHPVETRYLTRPARDARARSTPLSSRPWVEAVAAATRRALVESEGSVLVFVPGRREVSQVVAAVQPTTPLPVRPLHGGADHRLQREVLDARGRQVIVATAVAETSLTIPGVTAVVDGGLLRRPRFDPDTGLGRLETGWVTQFSADQRRGRAGRLTPGVCYRLWSEDDHRHLDQAARPEIVEGDPLPVAFELARWGDPGARSLPLIDHPGPARLVAAHRILALLGLVDGEGRLTERGDRAASLGLHPRLGALLTVPASGQSRELHRQLVETAALLDGDTWPTVDDLEADLARQRSAAPQRRELDRAAHRIEQRLARSHARSRSPATDGSERSEKATAPASLAEALAGAWPDRIAAARPGRAGRFLLAGGTEVAVAGGPLAGAEFLVVAEADGGPPHALVRRAVPLDRAAVLRAAAPHLSWRERVEWDDRTGAVRSQREQRLGSIVLHSQPIDRPSPGALASAMADGLRRRGLEVLTWTEGALTFRRRLAWLHDVDPAHWPDVSDQALLDRLDDWLDLGHCRRPSDLARLDVRAALGRLLDWTQRAGLDAVAPPQLPAADGRPIPVDYSSGRPVWRVRLQRLLGVDRHPLIGPHREPVTIELLSPAGRGVQVTADLPAFWRGSYAHVRSDLRGRYPKHAWPERPWEPVT